jgi:hypothetical protein
MADIDTNTIIIDGPQKFVASFVHTYVTTGEGTPVKKIDVSALAINPVNGNPCTGVRINKIWYSTIGLTLKINWFATTQVLAAQVPENYSDVLDFSSFSGLPNPTIGASGSNGDIYFGTVGEAANDSYTVVMECIKIYSST